MGRKLGNNSINGVLDAGPLNICFAAIVVLINCFQPSNIIMRMWNEMNSDIGIVGRGGMMVVFLHHFLVSEPDVGVEGKEQEKANEKLFHKEIFIKDMG